MATTKITFNQSAEAHKRVALAQRDALLTAADEVAAGRLPGDPQWIAAVLRWASDNIPKEQQGHPSRIDHGALELRYGWLRVHDRLSHHKALLSLEAEFGISWQGIDKRLTPAIRERAVLAFRGARVLKPKRR
jgi:hypothetical protein